MPDCCIEEAWLQALRGLNCTPIPEKSHFAEIRTGSETTPYVVVNVATVSGLRTSDGVQLGYSVRIAGYFDKDAVAAKREWAELLMTYLTGSRCLSLGNCGCFCVTSLGILQSTVSQQLLQVSIGLTGRYMSAGGSESGT